MTTKSISKKSSQAASKTSTFSAKDRDFRVCQEAMNDPKVFAELARCGREEIKIAESMNPAFKAGKALKDAVNS